MLPDIVVNFTHYRTFPVQALHSHIVQYLLQKEKKNTNCVTEQICKKDPFKGQQNFLNEDLFFDIV